MDTLRSIKLIERYVLFTVTLTPSKTYVGLTKRKHLVYLSEAAQRDAMLDEPLTMLGRELKNAEKSESPLFLVVKEYERPKPALKMLAKHIEKIAVAGSKDWYDQIPREISLPEDHPKPKLEDPSNPMVYLYRVDLGGGKTFVGLTRDVPDQKIADRKDAEADVPRTFMGRELKSRELKSLEHPTYHVVKGYKTETYATSKLQNTIDALQTAAAPDVAPWYDQIPRELVDPPPYFDSVIPYDVPPCDIEYPQHFEIYWRPWMSEEANDEFERDIMWRKPWMLNADPIHPHDVFIVDPDPAKNDPVQVLLDFYKASMLDQDSMVAMAYVYDPTTRKVAVYRPSPDVRLAEKTPVDFATEAAEWIGARLERLCLRILGGATTANPQYDVEKTSWRCRAILDTLHRRTASGYRAVDVACGRVRSTLRPNERGMHKSLVRGILDLIMHHMKPSTRHYNLKAVYPKDHPRYPKKRKPTAENNIRDPRIFPFDLRPPHQFLKLAQPQSIDRRHA